MSRYLGAFQPSDTVRCRFNTDDAARAPITLAGSPVVSIYKDDSTTEVTTGVTLTVGFDSRTGMHDVTVDTSTDSTFYAAGSTFFIVLTTGTVNAISVVGKVVRIFRIATLAASSSTVTQRGRRRRHLAAILSGGNAGRTYP